MIGWTRIVISAEAFDDMRNHPLPGHRLDDSEARRLADGRWSIRVHRSVRDRLEASRMAGETVSETIQRLLAFARSGGKAH